MSDMVAHMLEGEFHSAKVAHHGRVTVCWFLGNEDGNVGDCEAALSCSLLFSTNL